LSHKLLFEGQQSTPSSTPTVSTVALGLFGEDIDPNIDEPDVEEVMGGVAITAKKQTIEDDELLISNLINGGTDFVVRTYQIRLSFWGKVAASFN